MKKLVQTQSDYDMFALIFAVVSLTILICIVLYIKKKKSKMELDEWKKDQSLSLKDHSWGDFTNEFKN